MLKRFLGIKLVPAVPVLDDLVFSPATADLEPGKSVTITVAGRSGGASFQLTTLNSATTPTTGVTITRSGLTFTATAPATFTGTIPVPLPVDVDAS
jgi:hypothetical protein